MKCDEARELIGADPQTADPQLLAHLDGCAECQAYRDQMLAANAKIRRALELDLPAMKADRPNVIAFARKTEPSAVKTSNPRRVVAIAASLAAGLLAAFALWLSRPSESLAAEVVAHVEGEPNSWDATGPVPTAELEAVLRKSGVKMGTAMGTVVYASSCWFRGRFVPHLVVSTRSGPVTVIILKNEKVHATEPFNEDGYSGMLVPARTGSVAILSRTPMSLDQSARDVLQALQEANP
jgi:hypothetical protein